MSKKNEDLLNDSDNNQKEIQEKEELLEQISQEEQKLQKLDLRLQKLQRSNRNKQIILNARKDLKNHCSEVSKHPENFKEFIFTQKLQDELENSIFSSQFSSIIKDIQKLQDMLK